MSKLRLLLITSLVVLLVGSGTASAQNASPSAPRIEVAFALDATGSMEPYIAQARQRIQQIAESLSQGNPKPDVRFAVVAYRDKGDDFVTRNHAFTRDLSVMQGYLKETSAKGGGDNPEAVLEALRDAITKLEWTPASDKSVIRLLYLVGDAPAQHYADSPSEAWIAKEAGKRHIVIHSLACGTDSSLEKTFERLARYTEGRFFRLNDSAGSVAQASTRGESSGLAATVTGSVRDYSSSVGVDYDSEEAEPIAATPWPAGVAPAAGVRSGLLGAHVRWARDSKSFHALWVAHMSLTKPEDQTPVPSVDFSRYHVLVLGGSDAGLELLGVERRGLRRAVRVKPTDNAGPSFLLIPAEPNHEERR